VKLLDSNKPWEIMKRTKTAVLKHSRIGTMDTGSSSLLKKVLEWQSMVAAGMSTTAMQISHQM